MEPAAKGQFRVSNFESRIEFAIRNSQFAIAPSGVTLLEILVAMLILGLVTGGIFTAFVFARRTNVRSEGELIGYNHVNSILEQVRLATGGPSPGGLPLLAPGVYVDTRMVSPPLGATPHPSLDLPPDFAARYQTNQGRTPEPTWEKHGDGMVMVVEDHNTDLDEDKKKGLKFSATGTPPDLYRVRVYLKKSTPTATP